MIASTVSIKWDFVRLQALEDTRALIVIKPEDIDSRHLIWNIYYDIFTPNGTVVGGSCQYSLEFGISPRIRTTLISLVMYLNITRNYKTGYIRITQFQQIILNSPAGGFLVILTKKNIYISQQIQTANLCEFIEYHSCLEVVKFNSRNNLKQ